MKNGYSYVIIKHNYPALERESALLENNYKPKLKYAMINKIVHKDGSESTAFIEYSSNLELLQSRASSYVSWYNYPIGLSKSINGYISTLP